MSQSNARFQIEKWHENVSEKNEDFIAREEPLQIVIDGRPLAVLMRTPGDDEPLITGFLFTEGIISKYSQIRSIDLEGKDNHALVFLADGHEVAWAKLTRHLFSASSCGLCGKATIDAIIQNHAPLQSNFTLPHHTLLKAPEILRKAQHTFSSTGGLHASGLLNAEGHLLIIHEDIGRHNALDKIIGHCLAQQIDFSESFLLLSGRISFELMQKAHAAGIPIIAGISAPSSLAIEFAEESQQTLIGFLRPPSFNLYTGTQRITHSPLNP